MSNKYEKKLVEDYTVLRATADKTETLQVRDGKAVQTHEYDTETQAQEVLTNLEGEYVVGYSTQFDLRVLNRYADSELEYGEISKLLKRMLPDLQKMSLEKYCTEFGIEGNTQTEKVYRLYETVKETIRRNEIEKQVIGTSRKAFKLELANLRIVYEDIKDRLGYTEDTADRWGGWDFDVESDDSDLNTEPEPDAGILGETEDTDNFVESDDFDFDLDTEADENFDDMGDNFAWNTDKGILEDYDEDDIESMDYEGSPDDSDFEEIESTAGEEEVDPIADEDELEDIEPAVEEEETEPAGYFETPNVLMDEFTADVEPQTVTITTTEEDLTKDDTINTLEQIYLTYKGQGGHFLWTKWMAQQTSRAKDDNNVTDEFHEASATMDGNYLKEFYYHLRDDLHAEILPCAQRYSARSQIMVMCLDAVVNKGHSRLYSEMAEGLYIEFVLNQTESKQAEEMRDFQGQPLSPRDQMVYAPLRTGQPFPLGIGEGDAMESEPDPRVYEPEIDVDEPATGELNVGDLEEIPQEPQNPTPVIDDYERIQEPYYEQTTEAPIANSIYDEPMPQPEPKKKKKSHKFLRFLLWLVILACMTGLGLFSYGYYVRNEALKADNIQLSYELKEANEKLKDLEPAKESEKREDKFGQTIYDLYKHKKYSVVKDLIENYYGTDTADMPSTIVPIYNATLRFVK